MNRRAEDPEVLATSVIELLDALYHARVGLREENSSEWQKAKARSVYERAQTVLDGTDQSKLFPKVQRALGLLQAVILYGVPSDDGTRPLYQLRHVETNLDLKAPWLRVDETLGGRNTWQRDAAERQDTMNLVFKRFRDDPALGVREFVDLLLVDRHRLSQEEDYLNYVIVSDAEQSFFSLLWCLFEAMDDASDPNELAAWASGEETVMLRSLFCHTNLDGPELRASDTATRALSPAPWNDHYWKRATYFAAAEALGLLSSRGVRTERLVRLAQWINRRQRHPCLSAVRFKVAGRLRIVEEALDELVEEKPIDADVSGLCRIANWMVATFGGSSVVLVGRGETEEEHPRSSDALRDLGIVRFNLPGEYLLRRNESIDRTFFATPLNEVYIERAGRPHTTAFALGTLLDLAQLPANTLALRLKLLRQVLDAIAQFGLADRLAAEAARLERGRRERRRLMWLRHQVFTSLKRLQGAIELARPAVRQSDLEGGLDMFLWSQFCNVYTLLEYFTGKGQESKWPRRPHEMLSTLGEWVGLRSGRTVTVDCIGDNPTVDTDLALHLYIVLVNLVHNAVKFAEHGGEVRLGCSSANEDVLIVVENTGAEMPKHFCAYLEGVSRESPSDRDPPQEGLQTVRYTLEEVGLPWPKVETPVPGTTQGTRVTLLVPGAAVKRRSM